KGFGEIVTHSASYPKSQDAFEEHRKVRADTAIFENGENEAPQRILATACMERKTWEPPHPHAILIHPVRIDYEWEKVIDDDGEQKWEMSGGGWECVK